MESQHEAVAVPILGSEGVFRRDRGLNTAACIALKRRLVAELHDSLELRASLK